MEGNTVHLFVNFGQSCSSTRICSYLIPTTIHREHRVLYSKQIRWSVTETIDTNWSGIYSLLRNIWCSFSPQCLNIGTESVNACDDAFNRSIGLLSWVLDLFVIYSSCRSRWSKCLVNGIERLLEFGSLFCRFLGSLFCCKIFAQFCLILLLVFSYQRIELLVGEGFALELLIKIQNFENLHKFFFEVHKN